MSANTYAVLINEDGTMDPKRLSSSLDKQVTQLQELVDGWFEFVRLDLKLGGELPIIMAVNDEGRLRPMGVNVTASKLAGQFIAGPAVLVSGPTPEGDVVGFDAITASNVMTATTSRTG